MTDAFYGILIPFLGTSLGAASVFFLKKSLGDYIQRALTGFAAGVMVGIHLEPADPCDGPVRSPRQAGVFPGGGGFLDGDPVFAAAGSYHPTPAPEQPTG